MSITVENVQSSELSRNSAAVFSAAEKAPVLVTRRDGEDLVLMSKREASARGQLLELAARLLAVITDERGSLISRMSGAFPWMHALSDEDKAQCTSDLVRAAQASFATDQSYFAMQEINAWKETASAVAAGLGKEPTDWIEKTHEVKHP
ncbi:MAG: prevent-host-death protein [Micrococcales bacterium]